MNYFAALPPAIALPSKLHTAYQKVIPLANGFPFNKLLCELGKRAAVTLSMDPAINLLIFTLHLQTQVPRLYCHSVRNATATSDNQTNIMIATSDDQTIKHHDCNI
jgi:hypothetical protein